MFRNNLNNPLRNILFNEISFMICSVIGEFSCLLVQMLLHIFEIRILLSTNKKSRKLNLPVIQVKLDLRKFCIQTEDNEVIRNKLYNGNETSSSNIMYFSIEIFLLSDNDNVLQVSVTIYTSCT